MHFQMMEVQLGDLIREAIIVLCYDPITCRIWSRLAKVHLKHPSKDGMALLKGGRIFTITLNNNALTIAKIAESCDFLPQATC